MQGKKPRQEKLFLTFQLSNYVPANNFYRRLSGLLDLEFLYKLTLPYYGREGQKSIDPVVFMKLMLVGYLENLNSDRRIIETSRMRMDILYFIGYDIDEELPWHSTLSRTRQLYGEHVFNELFKRVLKQCITQGMLGGKRQAVDGFFIKANASMDSLIEKEIMEDAAEFGRELKANEGDDNDTGAPPAPTETQPRSTKKTSNDTHYSPSDPDAKMSVKPHKPLRMNYLGQVSVDTESYIITHIQAFTADKRDSGCLAAMLQHTQHNLEAGGAKMYELVADTGYSSPDALKALQASGVRGYIPNRPQFKYERAELSYNASGDCYQCSQGITIPYLGTYLTAGYWMKEYGAGGKQCRLCPVNHKCDAYKPKTKRLTVRETIDKPYYEIMHERMQTDYGQRMMKVRQSTVEPVIGTLVNFTGIGRVYTKGIALANKCVTLAAIAYNLKKMVKSTLKAAQNLPLSSIRQLSVFWQELLALSEIKVLRITYQQDLILLL
jgi:transposase